MKTVIRFAVPLIVLLAIVASIMLPVTDRRLNRWLEHDVEQRSQLTFDTVRVRCRIS